MALTDIYTQLGEDRLRDLLRHVSMGKLKTFQMFDRLKARAHLSKLSSESLRNAAPKLLGRIQGGDDVLAQELAQCILVSHLPMITAVLDHLGVPHSEGFFDKEADVAAKLEGAWQQSAYTAFADKHPQSVLVFYLNHLANEVTPDLPVFLPAA
jgi:hypothetical protein